MKKLLFALTWLSAMFFGSCAQEWRGDNGPIGDPYAQTLSLTMEVESRPGHSVSTRVAATQDEKTVNSLYLLFFESSADRSGEFVDYIEIENPAIGPGRNDIDMSNSLLNVTAAYNILAIANIGRDDDVKYIDKSSVDGWMQQWAGRTETDVIRDAKAWTAANPGITPDGLLMSGSTTKAANSFEVSLKLVRNQIRFDVVNNASQYQLVSVGIYNAYPVSKIWNDGSSEGAMDYTESMSRIKDYYGFSGSQFLSLLETGSNPDDPEAVHGHFYVFENQVASPVQNDNTTTCLIIGLDGGSGIRYYRVNISPNNSAQILYRNHAYILTINSVIGEGHESKSDAYNDPDNDGLNYVINQWGDGETGTADQDGNSMLSSPYKKVDIDLFTGEIRGRAERGLNPRSFDITAVTSLPVGSYSALDIIGTPEFHLNGSEEPYTGITVDLVDGKLIFDQVEVALPAGSTGQPGPHNLESGDKITGTVTLGFAGLRIYIDVVQTDLVTDFLNIYLPEGGIPRFAPFAGIKSGNIRVEASGNWSAKILSESEGAFGFYGIPELSIGPKPLTDKEFAVETKSDNNDAKKVREAFVVISLDKDPLNYSRVVRLTQQQMSKIAISPAQTVTLDGTFEDGSGNLALIANNTTDTFEVFPGTQGDVGSEIQNPWTYRIEVQNPANSNLWEVAYIEENVGNSPQGVRNPDLNWFKITTVHNTALDQPNTFTVNVLGKNTTGRTRTARIVAYIQGTNPDGVGTAKASINLVQLSSSITLSPNSVPAVAKIGGTSQIVGIQGDVTSKWKVLEFNTVSGANGRGLQLVHHEAELIVVDGSGTPVSGTDGIYPVSTHKFRVRFPKIYYPNRDIPISAVVKIAIVDEGGVPTDLTATMTINQTTLTSNGFNVWGLTGEVYDFGQLGNTYNRGWDGNSGNYGIRHIPGYRYVGAGTVYTDAAIHSSVNYLHATVHLTDAHATNYTWKVINDYISGRDAWTVLQGQAVNGTRALNNSNSPFRKAGYTTNVEYGHDRNGMVDPRQQDTKLFKMIFDNGNTPITDYGFTNGSNYLYIDGVNTYINRSGVVGKSATSAVVLVSKHQQGGDGTPISDDAVLIVDIENKFMWMGESQLFWYDTWLTNGRGTFLDNIMYFVANASKYGSHFTDLLLEEDVPAEKQTPAVDGGRYAQPAPWEAYWGANGGVPSK